MTIGWPSEQTSSVSSVVQLLARERLALLLDERDERVVELVQQRHPAAPAGGDLIELGLHARGEVVVDVVAEVLHEHVGHDTGDRLRSQPSLLDPDVATVLDRGDGGRVRRGPADAVLLQSLDERRFGVARWRLGEVLARLRRRSRSTARPRRSAGSRLSTSSSAPSSRPSV